MGNLCCPLREPALLLRHRGAAGKRKREGKEKMQQGIRILFSHVDVDDQELLARAVFLVSRLHLDAKSSLLILNTESASACLLPLVGTDCAEVRAEFRTKKESKAARQLAEELGISEERLQTRVSKTGPDGELQWRLDSRLNDVTHLLVFSPWAEGAVFRVLNQFLPNCHTVAADVDEAQLSASPSWRTRGPLREEDDRQNFFLWTRGPAVEEREEEKTLLQITVESPQTLGGTVEVERSDLPTIEAARSDPPVEERKDRRTLVLGMAFVTEEYARRSRKQAKSGTSSAPARDRARLLQLQRMGYDLVTLNWGQEVADCEPGRHFQGMFTARGARTFAAQFPQRLDFVFLDYFRFPGEYMRQHYGELFRSMLPELVKRGVVDSATRVVVPNLPGLVDDQLHKILSTHRPLTADEYDLYVATSHCSADELGAFSNAVEIGQLDKTHPFVEIRLKTGKKRKAKKDRDNPLD